MFRAEFARARTLAAAVAAVVALAPVAARAQKPRSKQEEQRRKLLEELGLKKSEAAPVAPAPAVVPEAETPEEKVETRDGTRTAAPAAPAAPSFRRAIHPLLVQACKGCHAAGAPAAATALILSGDAALDYAAVRRVVDVHAPAASAVLAKASGQKLHAGGAPWAVGGAPYARVLAWIQGGARLDGAGRAAPPAVAASPSPDASKVARKGAPAPAIVASPSTPAAPAAPAENPTPPSAEEGSVDLAAPSPARPAADDFAAVVHPLLVRTCGACHSPVGPAAATRLVLSGDVAADYAKVRPLVDPTSPAASPLLTKAAGEMHAGGVVLKAGGAEHATVLGWVAAGALEHPAAVALVPAPVGSPAVAPAQPPALPPPPSVAVVTAASPRHAGPGGVGLPLGFMLNGRFDLNYERNHFTGGPFGDTATNSLRSYHHFLFLSRESADDPFGLSLEILTLQFWEVHYRWRAERLPIRVLVSGGKIFVPFGADPLMHQSYGGLVGFDQKILPPVWAQEGGAVHVTFSRRALAITDDLYVVHGYALRQPDGVLNLQNDFSPADDVKLGWGNRLGVSFGPLSAWYSAYYNPLGFGRRLFMQAGDVMLARMRGVPVLQHFSFAAGVLRADVSGGDDTGVGGPGLDYYDFGSYFQFRYYPADWLIFQYRQGLQTFNNRRGAIVDDTRLTSEDGSAHNFGVIARYRGLTGGLFWFINLEKGPEVPNDFIRVSVSYDF